MKDYAQSTGEFKKWKNDATKRMHFMVSVTDAVNSLMMQSVGMESTSNPTISSTSDSCFRRPLEVPCCGCSRSVSHVAEWHERHRINEPLLTFSRGRQQPARCEAHARPSDMERGSNPYAGIQEEEMVRQRKKGPLPVSVPSVRFHRI
jgi:hypothetical protein